MMHQPNPTVPDVMVVSEICSLIIVLDKESMRFSMILSRQTQSVS